MLSQRKESHKKYIPYDSTNVVKKWTELISGLEVKRVISLGVDSDWEGKRKVSGVVEMFSYITCILVTLVFSLCVKFVKLYVHDLCTFLHVYCTLIKIKNTTLAWSEDFSINIVNVPILISSVLSVLDTSSLLFLLDSNHLTLIRDYFHKAKYVCTCVHTSNPRSQIFMISLETHIQLFHCPTATKVWDFAWGGRERQFLSQ